MKNLKGISINDLIYMDAEEHDRKIHEALETTTDYNKHNKIITDSLEEIKKVGSTDWNKLDMSISLIESCVMDTSFEQGFKTAVKLMFSCMNS